MQRLLAALFAVGAAVVAVADTQVVCSITPQAQTACSALTVSQAAQLDPCRCNPTPTPTPTPEPSVYDDAVSLWKLDEASGTRADSIGSNDLTDNNTVLYRNLGPAGTVAAFAEGANEYLSIASGWTHGTSYMYTGWVKNPSPANFDSVITTNLANFNANVMIALYVSGGILRAVQADETGANPVTIDSLVSLSDGGWHFFAVWFDDADKKLRLSVDLETAVASAAMTGNYKTYPGASNLYIGSATGTTDAWDGNIARVGYYSTAGSDAIRTSLYNSGKGKAYADLTTAEKVGLVSYWDLDEASGTRYDSSYEEETVASFIRANSEYLSHASIAVSEDHTLVMWYRLTGTFGALYEIENISYEYSGGNHVFGTGAGGISGLDYIEDGGWHMYAIRQDGSTAKGSNDAGTVFTRAVTPPAAAARAFRFNYVTGTDFSDQRMARIGFWNRALSDGELTAIYNSGHGKAYSDLTTAEKVGLVSYWNLDEASGNRADSHGSNTLTDNNTVGSVTSTFGNDLTDNNTVTSATNSYPANLPGTVASFVAANNERLSHADDATLKFGTGDFTFSGWINPTSFAGTNGIIDKGVQQDYTLDANGGNLRFYSVNGGGYPIASVAQPFTGAWHHVVVWRSSADSKWYIQLDGGTPGEASAVIVSSDTTGAFTLGGLGATNYYNGLMSSVALWSRVLTPEERAALFNSGAGAPLP